MYQYMVGWTAKHGLRCGGEPLFHGSLAGRSGLFPGRVDEQEQILEQFRLFTLGTDGMGDGWARDRRAVFDRLDGVDKDPSAKVQLNQLLAFGHEAPVSDDFFANYWLSAPKLHP